MSEIKVNSIKGVGASVAALSINNTDGTCSANISANHGSQLGNRRININGDMQIWQRSTSASGIGASNGYFACDRYRSSNNGAARYTMSRSTDTPNGFGYSMKIDVTTEVTSPSANNYVFIQHRIEGQDVQGFAKGSSDAKTFALSFYVKSPKAGTHIIQLEDVENTRSVSKSYTVNVANTWEKKTIIFPADTTGAITPDNANRLQLYIWLMASSTYSSGSLATTWGTTVDANRAFGQVNCFDDAANNFYITGIQLEVGGVTDFEHRSYADELRRCQRYYYVLANGNQQALGDGLFWSASEISFITRFPVEMRASPDFDQSYGTDYFKAEGGGYGDGISSYWRSQYKSTRGTNHWLPADTNGTTGLSITIFSNNASAKLAYSAEL